MKLFIPRRTEASRYGGRERRTTKWFISLGPPGGSGSREENAQCNGPSKNPTHTPALDPPAICTIIFISLFHQHMLSSKWDFMAAVRCTALQLDRITFLPSSLSCVHLRCHSSQCLPCSVRGEWRRGGRVRPQSDLLHNSQETSHIHDAVLILAP